MSELRLHVHVSGAALCVGGVWLIRQHCHCVCFVEHRAAVDPRARNHNLHAVRDFRRAANIRAEHQLATGAACELATAEGVRDHWYFSHRKLV